MSELTLGNQDEKPQDLDRLENNLEAAIAQQVKNVNANPSKFMPKGCGEFDVLTEMGAAKAGTVAGMASVGSDMASPGTGSASNSMFMMNGTGRKSKATKRLESLSSTTNAMGLKKTYSEMRDDNRQLNRIMAGRGKASKDPLGGGGDKAIKMSQNKKTISVQAVRNNPTLAKAIGAGALSETLSLTRHEKDAPSTAAVVQGALENKPQMVAKAESLPDSAKQTALKKFAGPKPPSFLLSEKDKKNS